MTPFLKTRITYDALHDLPHDLPHALPHALPYALPHDLPISHCCRDGDGEVSKAEFRIAFKSLFPDAKFEMVWKQIDKDGDGSLSMAELANYYGLGHLVKVIDW